MSVADALNRALARARDDAAGEQQLIDAYRAEIRRGGRRAAAAFRERAVVAAASWGAPTVAEITGWSISSARIRGAQRTMMAAIGGQLAGVPGIDFSLTQPVIQRLLDQMGARAEGTIREGVRAPVARAIAEGWAKGDSVPATAARIQQAVDGVAGWQATMLARTDLIGLSNGGGHWAVEKLNAGAERNGERKVIQTKTWTSAGDSRVRESHQEADGQTVGIDVPFTVGGAHLKYPGDPSGPHDEVVNCRCVEIFNEEAAAAPPAVEAPPEPDRVPFSQLLKLPDSIENWNPRLVGDTRDALLSTVDAFDRALSGGLPQAAARKLEPIGGRLPIGTKRSLDAHGEYRFVGNSPVGITIREEGQHMRNTLMHELGHYLDHQTLADEPGFASVGAPTREMLAFRRAVDESAATKQIQALKHAGAAEVEPGKIVRFSDGGRRYLDYLLDPREQWARAFAQYMARHGGQDALDELDRIITDERLFPDQGIEIHTQWTHDDFEPIAAAIEDVLTSRGLLKAGGLTAAFWRYLHEILPGRFPTVERRDPFDRLFWRQVERGGDEGADLLLRPPVGSRLMQIDHRAQRIAASSRPDAGLPCHGNREEDDRP